MFIFEIYHQHSKHKSKTIKTSTSNTDTSDAWQTFFIKRYERFPITTLPSPTPIPLSLSSTLLQRRSCRSFRTGITPEALSSLLHFSLGEKPKTESRMYPSAGALYPLEFYLVICTKIDHLATGIYHYGFEHNTLTKIRDLQDIDDFRKKATIDGAIYNADCLILCTSTFNRSSMKYGERAYRLAYLEAGATTQNLSLTATALGLGSVIFGSGIDEYLEKLLDIDGSSESLVYCMGFGIPNKST